LRALAPEAAGRVERARGGAAGLLGKDPSFSCAWVKPLGMHHQKVRRYNRASKDRWIARMAALGTTVPRPGKEPSESQSRPRRCGGGAGLPETEGAGLIRTRFGRRRLLADHAPASMDRGKGMGALSGLVQGNRVQRSSTRKR